MVFHWDDRKVFGTEQRWWPHTLVCQTPWDCCLLKVCLCHINFTPIMSRENIFETGLGGDMRPVREKVSKYSPGAWSLAWPPALSHSEGEGSWASGSPYSKDCV